MPSTVSVSDAIEALLKAKGQQGIDDKESGTFVIIDALLTLGLLHRSSLSRAYILVTKVLFAKLVQVGAT